jgi:hypothetical protein
MIRNPCEAPRYECGMFIINCKIAQRAPSTIVEDGILDGMVAHELGLGGHRTLRASQSTRCGHRLGRLLRALDAFFNASAI